MWAGVVGALAAGGCSSSSEGPAIAAEAIYSGPTITLDSAGEEHVAKVLAPTGGYRFTIDQVRETKDAMRAFLTLRRPDPTMYHTQAMVEHRVASTVPTWTGIEVYAREVEFIHSDTQDEVAYSLVLKAPPSRPAPQGAVPIGKR